MGERSTPDVTVVVPVYRRPELLRSTLASLCNQTLRRREFEVIVCDDGTPDTSALLAHNTLCLPRGRRIPRWRRKEHGCSTGAWPHGGVLGRWECCIAPCSEHRSALARRSSGSGSSRWICLSGRQPNALYRR